MITTGLMIIAFAVGLIVAAWCFDADIRNAQRDAAYWRREASKASGRAAHNAQKAEHARAEREWGGRYQ